MTTYVHPLGSHLKVHSKHAKSPTERDKPDPGILIIYGPPPVRKSNVEAP